MSGRTRSVPGARWAARSVWLVLAACGSGGAREGAPPAQAQSRIVMSDSGCSGLDAHRALLEDVGLGGVEATTVVRCVVADFDANGTLDAALWGVADEDGTRPFKLLLFQGDTVLQAATIRKPGYAEAVLWPRGTGPSGACQVEPQPRDGLMLPGEGAGSWYFTFDPTSGGLREQLVCDE